MKSHHLILSALIYSQQGLDLSTLLRIKSQNNVSYSLLTVILQHFFKSHNFTFNFKDMCKVHSTSRQNNQRKKGGKKKESKIFSSQTYQCSGIMYLIIPSIP